MIVSPAVEYSIASRNEHAVGVHDPSAESDVVVTVNVAASAEAEKHNSATITHTSSTPAATVRTCEPWPASGRLTTRNCRPAQARYACPSRSVTRSQASQPPSAG